MPIKTPFFPRMFDACTSMNWKNWAGYYAVNSYQVLHDMEYYALRNAAALFDISPLFKYKITGKEAGDYLSRIMVKNIRNLPVGRVAYCCWCTEQGMVVDDGTVMRRGEEEFLVTSAEPQYSWFSRFMRGYEVELEDLSDHVGALSLQGPMARDILKQIIDPSTMDKLRYFHTQQVQVDDDFDIHISRTGYTGDLGYELWVENEHALKLWDAIVHTGKNYALRPAGIMALDVSRVEAGLVMAGVDFHNALHCLVDSRKSTPYEITLGWTVDLDREAFNGQQALIKENERGPRWLTVGLDIDWPELEKIYAKYGLPPEVCNKPWRSSIPVYLDRHKRKQVGYGTSGTWSPILKKNIALATIESKYAHEGNKLQFEVTVEHRRHTVSATVCKPQFFKPERKTSRPTIKKKVTASYE